MSAIKPFSDVVADLAECCRDKKNGVFFITTESNRSAYLTLKDGDIESIHYMNKRGADALEQLRTVRAGTCRFSAGTENALFGSQSLPETEIILTELATTPSDSSTTDSEMPHTANSAPSVDDYSDDDLLELLVEFMGPMASVVYSDAKENTRNTKVLIKKLATEIPDNHQQNEFMERAHKLIRGES